MIDRSRRAGASHFERRAAEGAPERDWRFGAQRVAPALRAPYQHLERWLARTALGMLILDYGCGRGVHSVAAARYGARVVGVDLSPSSLTIARERADRAGMRARVDLAVADGATLPFAASTFDHALAVDVLSYIPPRTAFAELARVLRPGGTLVLLDTLGHNPLLNVNRRFRAWRNERTPDEVRYVPRIGDLAVGREHFAEVETAYFDLVTPVMAALRITSPTATRWAMALDRALLRRRLLRPLAFKAVCMYKGPRASATLGP